MLTTLNAGALKGALPHNDNEGNAMSKFKALKNFVLKGHGVVMQNEVLEIPKHEVNFLVAAGRIVAVEDAPAEIPLDKLTKEALLEMALEKGIVEAVPAMKKAEIIALLEK